MSCGYNHHAHYTPNAFTYHTDKCVSEWMTRMSSVEHCVEYMAGIGAGNSDMQKCTVSDLEDICAHENANFSVEDAKALCHELNKGHSRFWASYYEKHEKSF